MPNKHPRPANTNLENVVIDKKIFVNEITTKVDVAVLIIDVNGRQHNPLSSDIAKLYSDNSGKTASTSLFTSTFLSSRYLNYLFEANSQVIENLKLSNYCKYIIVGRYSSEFEAGEHTKYICRATLDVSILSCESKSRIDGFLLEAANPYDDKSHAEKGAREKIIGTYKAEYLKL